MPVIAITRGGAGRLFIFPSVDDADEHPVVQFGDAILRDHDDVMRCFSLQELRVLAAKIGAQGVLSEIDYAEQTQRGGSSVWPLAWAALKAAARVPPSNPAEIVEIIREDRRVTRANGVKTRFNPSPQHGVKSMTDENTAAETETKVRRAPQAYVKIDRNATIHFGVDKEGVHYGPDHNPKRAGSAAAERFSLYRDGMTVEQALAAGVTSSDVNWDFAHGFITVEPPKEIAA